MFNCRASIIGHITFSLGSNYELAYMYMSYAKMLALLHKWEGHSWNVLKDFNTTNTFILVYPCYTLAATG